MKANFPVSLGLGLTLLGVAGCGDPRPEGMPELYPTTVTITQEGEPLAGAMVSLYPENSELARWPVGGKTDENGVATMMTYTKYPGAPAGTFKVSVNRTITEGDPIPKHPGRDATQEELAAYDRAMKTGSFEVYQVVAPEYRTAGTTPLTVEVIADEENDLTNDVGPAVRDREEQGGVTGKREEYVPMGGNSE